MRSIVSIFLLIVFSAHLNAEQAVQAHAAEMAQGELAASVARGESTYASGRCGELVGGDMLSPTLSA